MSPERVAAKEVARLLQGLQVSLKERGVKPENMRVQLERDLVSSLDIPPQKLIQWADQKLGLKLVVLDSQEQARQTYLATMQSVVEKAVDKSHTVIAIESMQSAVLFGQDNEIDPISLQTGWLPYGTDQILLDNPWDLIDVALTRNDVKRRLQEWLPVHWLEHASQSEVFLARQQADDWLLQLENIRRPKGIKLSQMGLDRLLLHWYLSQPGLTLIQEQVQREVLNHEQAVLLVKRLILLTEMVQCLDISSVRFGQTSDTTRAVFEDLAKTQVQRHARTFGNSLHTQYCQQYEQAETILQRLFPNLALQGRVKTQNSIAGKLSRKAANSIAVSPMRNLSEAADLVSDGLGFCLVLEDCSRIRMEMIVDTLILAMRQEQLQIIELKNYHAAGANGLPYLSTDDILRIQQVARNVPEHPTLQIQDGEQAMKASGYTTAQWVLLLKNPKTRAFDLPPCELQIRGPHVHALYAVEHPIRDIRLGKFKDLNEIPTKMSALFQAVSQLNDTQFETLQAYLNEYYTYCRCLESHLPVDVPAKPKTLPAIFELNRLMKAMKVQKNVQTDMTLSADRPGILSPSGYPHR